MTEKERVLDFVVNKFLDEGISCMEYRDTVQVLNASHVFNAATMVAGWGAHEKTISAAVEKLMAESKKSGMLRSDYLKYAICMAVKGASLETTERLLAEVLKRFCWVWALERLTSFLKRDPTREEIFALIEAEVADKATYGEQRFEELRQLARKYLNRSDQQEVAKMLEDKLREWRSHPFD